MSKIRLLPDTLASQVAAGEVVERPASVVRELLENSIDAGAKNVDIRIRRGGVSTIRLIDDGCGMDRTDALLALERHATSKIATSEDLANIRTMGFRGEAIPSIASVSRFRLTTREANALAGTEILVEGGKLKEVRESGEAPGTQIEVRSLFYNLPARRKFLRTENTEFSHIEHQVRLHAIAHPHIGFSLVHNDRTVFRLPRTESLIERIRGLAGNELVDRLLEIRDQTRQGIRFHGYLGEPGLGRSSRALQWIFLNRRPIDGAVLQYALREGYHTALMRGQHPVTFLFLEMDPGQVDVNVHPAKREVRFHDGIGLRHALVDVIAETLAARIRPAAGSRSREKTEDSADQAPASISAPVPRSSSEAYTGGGGSPPPANQPSRQLSQASASHGELINPAEQHALRNDWASFPESPSGGSNAGGDAPARSSTAQPPANPVAESPGDRAQGSDVDASPSPRGEVPAAEDFRILGVLGKLYVLMENESGLVLMDQHAAHERVLFEQMRRRMESEGVPTQQLLMPIMLELPPKEFAFISRNLAVLQKLGIAAEPFGANTLKIDALPTFVSERDSNRFVNDVLDELHRDSQHMSSIRLGEDMVATTVCRHAVKANDSLHLEEVRRLLRDLLNCELPFCCPHGRPTLVQITYRELERKFGRIQP